MLVHRERLLDIGIEYYVIILCQVAIWAIWMRWMTCRMMMVVLESISDIYSKKSPLPYQKSPLFLVI